jgi:hemoglobin/transferrin/lactoferrin receptor protein
MDSQFFMIINRFSCFLLLMVLVLTAIGQEEESGLFRLDENDLIEGKEHAAGKVISASRSEKYVAGLPVTVYVVTGEEIRQNGYLTLTDVLRTIPGIRVSQPGSAIDGEMFVIRGLYGNYYTKVLVDNIPVQPSVVTGMPLAAQLPVRQADRIEIILGPASSMYGADAMTGVINIVTRSSERPVTADADITFGSPRYYALNAMIGGKAGKGKNVINYTFYGTSARQADMNVKYDIPGLYNPALYDSNYTYLDEPRYKGDSTNPVLNGLPQESTLLGLRAGYRGFKAGFDLMQRKTHSSIGQNTANYSYAEPSAFWGETIDRVFISYDHSWENISSTTQCSYLHYSLDNQSSFTMIQDASLSGKAYKYMASDDIFLDQVITWVPDPRLEMVGGISYQYSGNLPKTNDLAEPFDKDDYPAFSKKEIQEGGPLGSFGFNPHVFSNVGGFVQLYYKSGRFTALLGDRFDYHSIYGSSNNPRIAFLYSLKQNMTLRMHYGQGLRVPASSYSYNSLAFQRENGIYYRIVPNTDIKPEKLHTFELGYRFQPIATISIDLVGFYQLMNDYISLSLVRLDSAAYPDAVNPLGLSSAYINDENSAFRLGGLQAEITVAELIPAIDLAVDFSFSASKGEEVLPNDLGTLDDVRIYPRYIAQLNLSLRPVDRLYLTIQNSACSKSPKRFFPFEPELMERFGLPVYVDGYYVLDIIARINITRQLQAYLNIYNLLNSGYGGIDAYGYPTDLLYNPQYGRNFRFGLSFYLE